MVIPRLRDCLVRRYNNKKTIRNIYPLLMVIKNLTFSCLKNYMLFLSSDFHKFTFRGNHGGTAGTHRLCEPVQV